MRRVRNRKPRRVSLLINPFVSREQQKACYAKDDPAWDCHKWSHMTKGKLPDRKKKSTANAKHINVQKIDPTRTFTLRRVMTTKLEGQFARLKGHVVKAILVDDYLGLNKPVGNSTTLPMSEWQELPEWIIVNFNPDQPRDEKGRFTLSAGADHHAEGPC